MSRGPYSTREWVDEDLNNLVDAIQASKTTLAVCKTFIAVVIVMTRTIADVADAVRRPQ